MTTFDYFFTFYSLVLGLSVVEVVAGVARLVDARKTVKVGWLTPLLALFVAINITSFWGQAWALYRNAPFNNALMVVSLANAGVYYIAAYLVFPRDMASAPSLDEHYWQDRRWVLGGVLAANLISFVVFLFLMPANPGAAPSGEFVVVITAFFASLITAIAAPRGRVAVIALILLNAIMLEQLYDFFEALFATGGWAIDAYSTDNQIISPQ